MNKDLRNHDERGNTYIRPVLWHNKLKFNWDHEIYMHSLYENWNSDFWIAWKNFKNNFQWYQTRTNFPKTEPQKSAF